MFSTMLQHPLHDRRTICIPSHVYAKLSGSQKQFWDIKSKYMDVLLFFKVGTFYELYENDAQAAHDVLDWKMTITGVGHCRQVGCPEKGLPDAVATLVAAGAASCMLVCEYACRF
jgi:DNA mismatch repair protein MSH6